MRIRATVAALTGTLALSALVVPAAQADDGPNTRQLSASVAKVANGAAAGDTKITKVTVNGGKDVVIGTSAKKKFTVAITATDPEGIAGASGFMWHGPSRQTADGAFAPDDFDSKCKVVNDTTSTCTLAFTVDPKADIYTNDVAGSGWKVYAVATGGSGSTTIDGAKSDARVQRAARLTTNASPEPIKKGKTLTVTGALTRANWETSKYAGYTKQSVKLQYKKKGAASYTTLKTITSDTKGNLKTTVKASADGYYRYVFAGTSTTPAVTSTSDFVDVN
ncbi:calcium-binding protein [Streptomyces sp. NPDC056486]|uniref:calcium-binding protein n=1 Tax=Streptomyces sp. NPDC056486 TaxID=3345835 RepID=UPI0036ACD70E